MHNHTRVIPRSRAEVFCVTGFPTQKGAEPRGGDHAGRRLRVRPVRGRLSGRRLVASVVDEDDPVPLRRSLADEAAVTPGTSSPKSGGLAREAPDLLAVPRQTASAGRRSLQRPGANRPPWLSHGQAVASGTQKPAIGGWYGMINHHGP
jgi:hypothetical protein